MSFFGALVTSCFLYEMDIPGQFFRFLVEGYSYNNCLMKEVCPPEFSIINS